MQTASILTVKIPQNYLFYASSQICALKFSVSSLVQKLFPRVLLVDFSLQQNSSVTVHEESFSLGIN